ncbi:MAG: PHP domain-containing protein [Polyangiaceae bacterium]|nr:PHP domain-containing protein [Polyangiaceae bacterium]
MKRFRAPALWLLAIITVLGLLVQGYRRGARTPRPVGASVAATASQVRFVVNGAEYTFSCTTSLLSIRSKAGLHDVALAVATPDGDVPLMAHGADVQRTSATEARIALDLEVGEDRFLGTLVVRAEGEGVTFSLEGDDTPALTATVDADPRRTFVPQHGPLPEGESTAARIFVADFDVPLGFAGKTDMLDLQVHPKEPGETSEHIRMQAKGALAVFAARDPSSLWRPLFRGIGLTTFPLRGVVTGAANAAGRAGGVRVFGLDSEGQPRLQTLTAADGTFALEAPAEVLDWYSVLDESRQSRIGRFVPGENTGELRLDMAPGGTLSVRILDADTDQPLTARLIVHGIEGTFDPSFGPDFRATGAGCIVDALRGELTTAVPSGRYRILATKGLEYSLDGRIVDVKPGALVSLVLKPRHVLASRGVVGCDLHVHARPSFDTLVSPEDRVLSLVAAGIDFAVPSEHNIVGDYSSALRGMDLTGRLAFVPGVEVTPFAPRFGHFGVFPWGINAKVPPYKKTTPGQIFDAVRRDGDKTRVLQVNHPRMGKQIGYFEVERLDSKTGRHEMKARMDFDALEVLNGYEINDSSVPERVLADYYGLLNLGRRYVATGSSDSHRILFGWAGYPRTFVHLAPESAGDTGAPIDPMAVVAAIKKGHATVSAGPVVDMRIDEVSSGDTYLGPVGEIHPHVRVTAAPWVDVTELQIVVNGRIVVRKQVPRRPLRFGPELGTLEEAIARTVRLEEDIAVTLLPTDTWMLAVVRGETKLDEYLPWTPIKPIAFTNPIWLGKKP